MSIRITTVLQALVVSLALVAGAATGGGARAHEGHSHGAQAPAPPAQAAPRAEAVSNDFELVAVAAGDRVRLYLDRFATNEPVTGADVDVETPDGAVEAKAVGEGVYEIAAP